MSLVPCSSCRRHFRVSDASCPFCAAPRGDDAATRVIPPARKRLDRWATFTFATALVTAAACGGSTGESGGSDGGSDAALGDGGRTDGGPNDDGGMQALYGMAYDGGKQDVTVAPPYGVPPPQDAASDAPFDANGLPLYGMPVTPPDPFSDGG